MEVLDATSLVGRLNWEAKEYWVHIEAAEPLEKYPAKQHARRVQEKLGVEQGLIYLPGQPPKNNEDSDMPAPFRQRRYFYYMSGCNEAGCHVIYDIQHDTLSLFIPRIDEKRVIWNGRGSTLAEALVKYDIDEVYYADELSGFLIDWWNHTNYCGKLYVLHESQIPRLNPLASRGSHGDPDTISLQPAMDQSRMIKDCHEIKLIRKANDISSRAHKEILSQVLSFKNEAQVEGLFLDVCVSQQAKQQAYDPIAASGPNAGTLHYDANNEDFEDRQLMCLDAGCEYELYASDITRTFPLAPSWPSEEAKNIYKLVERMQETCIERLAPGVRYLDIHILAHQLAIDGLMALGILHNGTKEEIYKAGTSKAFFPHGLGHHVGLEVHDVGQRELMSVRKGKAVLEQAPSLYPLHFHLPVYDPGTCHMPTDPQSSQLEEGMVVTVEPGIYFSIYALQHFYLPSPIHSRYINFEVVQQYLPVGGVRIEDDILITTDGYENLTTAPKGDAMLEIIRTGSSINALYESQRCSLHSYDENKPSFRCAPGISHETPGQILKPLARAATMPVDLEPFNGPSLFSNFKGSMTTDERVEYWRKGQIRSTPTNDHSTTRPNLDSLCGSLSNNVRHVHMSLANTPQSGSKDCTSGCGKPICMKCNILRETLSRLRQTLSASENDSSQPKPKPKPTVITAGISEAVHESHSTRMAAQRRVTDSMAKARYFEREENVEQMEPLVRRKFSTPAVVLPPHDELAKGYLQTRAIEKAKTHVHKHGVPQDQNPLVYQRQLATQYFQTLYGNSATAASCQPMRALARRSVEFESDCLPGPEQVDQPLAVAPQVGMVHEPLSLRPQRAQPHHLNPLPEGVSHPELVKKGPTPYLNIPTCGQHDTTRTEQKQQYESTCDGLNAQQRGVNVNTSDCDDVDAQQLSLSSPHAKDDYEDQEEAARRDALARLRKIMGRIAQCSYRLRTHSDEISMPEQPTLSSGNAEPRMVLSSRERARLIEKRERLQVKRAAAVLMIQQRYPGMLPGWVI